MRLIEELCEGPELFESIKDGCVGAAQASEMMLQILQGVQYLHRELIMHRDIKPENIRFATTSSQSPLKILDFGLAIRFAQGEKYQKLVGSLNYMAPEMFESQGYNEKIDLWACGIMLFLMYHPSPLFLFFLFLRP